MVYTSPKQICFKSAITRINKRSKKRSKAKHSAKPSDPVDSSIDILKKDSTIGTQARHVDWWKSWEWHESWREFQILDQGKHALCNITSETVNAEKTQIQLDHPIVSAIGNCAVNDLCKEHTHIGKSNNLCHHQVMKCMYLKFSKLYGFYLTIEAIEEGILGVYEATVACDPVDGRGSLVKFILTDQRPTGKIATKLPHLISLKQKYSTLKGMKEDLEIKLGTLRSVKGTKNKLKVAPELIRLKEQFKAMKGICNDLHWLIQSQIPKSWNQRKNNPDAWRNFSNHKCGMQKRSSGATCSGYDFNTLRPDFFNLQMGMRPEV